MREYLRPMVRAVCLALMAIGATSVTGPRLGIAEMRITESATSSGLGIAEMRITERANRTVITAVNADNQTIAKLDLVHGRFVPTEYGPEFRGREVQGRKLYVEVRGQVITWETIGFTDTTHMPALPPNVNQVASFLSD